MAQQRAQQVFGVLRNGSQVKEYLLCYGAGSNPHPRPLCFQLTDTEWQALRLQNATSKNRGGRRYPPYAFTEHGAIMAATVLNSPQAIQMSITIVTAFVKLRRMALSVESLARKVAALEQHYDASFSAVFDAIRNLMEPPTPPRERIGFQ